MTRPDHIPVFHNLSTPIESAALEHRCTVGSLAESAGRVVKAILMATHHQTSPSGALHPHHGPPPTQLVQTNGHPPVPGPARPATTAEYLAQLNEQMWVQIGMSSEATLP